MKFQHDFEICNLEDPGLLLLIACFKTIKIATIFDNYFKSVAQYSVIWLGLFRNSSD